MLQLIVALLGPFPIKYAAPLSVVKAVTAVGLATVAVDHRVVKVEQAMLELVRLQVLAVMPVLVVTAAVAAPVAIQLAQPTAMVHILVG